MSVIIPTYNEENTVIQTIQSIIAGHTEYNNHNNVEIIISDGGSRDKTIEICQQFLLQSRPMKNYHIITGGTNRATCQNLGAKLSSGDILLFLHADSVLPVDWLFSVRGVMSVQRNLGGCFSFKLVSSNDDNGHDNNIDNNNDINDKNGSNHGISSRNNSSSSSNNNNKNNDHNIDTYNNSINNEQKNIIFKNTSEKTTTNNSNTIINQKNQQKTKINKSQHIKKTFDYYWSKTCIYFIEKGTNIRSHYLSLPYGDQSLFFRRNVFLYFFNSFPCVSLLEDYYLIKEIRKYGVICTVSESVQTSARRWEKNGYIWNTFLNQVSNVKMR